MEDSLVMTIAPMGCYSTEASFGAIQRETQSYIRNSVYTTSDKDRKAIIRKVLSSRRNDKTVIAAVESYFFRNARVSEWHILTDDQKSKTVCEFVSRVWAAAAGIKIVEGQKKVSPLPIINCNTTERFITKIQHIK